MNNMKQNQLEKQFAILHQECGEFDDAMTMYGMIACLNDKEGEDGVRRVFKEAGYTDCTETEELDGLIAQAKGLMKKYPELV
jgi:hypothetical protein